jgi:dTDP-4-dehydrorhamnose 3,5-epimerase
VLYKVTAPYSPSHDRGLAFNDPVLGIDWRIPRSDIILSEKDTKYPLLSALPRYFD